MASGSTGGLLNRALPEALLIRTKGIF
jgi:hypothetical protein